MKTVVYTHSRGAEMRAFRIWLGYSTNRMARLFSITRQSYEDWESGRGAIPSTVWVEVADMRSSIETQVTEILATADASLTPIRVPLNERHSTHPDTPGLWPRIVSEAASRSSRVIPSYDHHASR